MKKYNFDSFNEFYKEVFQNRETFSSDIREQIQSDLEKMAEEYNKWVEKRDKEKRL